MIKNEKEYSEAQERLKGWRKSFEEMESKLPADAFSIYSATHSPLVRELEDEIREYEVLKYGREEEAYFTDLLEVGRWVVRQRIRRRLTQTEFGTKLHLSQAQISRDEDIEYRTAPLMRIYEILKVLDYPVIEFAAFRTEDDLKKFNTRKVTELLSGTQSVSADASYSVSPIGQTVTARG